MDQWTDRRTIQTLDAPGGPFRPDKKYPYEENAHAHTDTRGMTIAVQTFVHASQNDSEVTAQKYIYLCTTLS